MIFNGKSCQSWQVLPHWNLLVQYVPLSTSFTRLKVQCTLILSLLRFTPILFFWTYLFFSCDYSSLPCHRPADPTCLRNRFLPSASSDFSDSFLLTHMHFFAIPSHSTMFLLLCHLLRNFPSLWYINPRLAIYSLKLDLLCTLVHCYTNLVLFSFSRL